MRIIKKMFVMVMMICMMVSCISCGSKTAENGNDDVCASDGLIK